MSVYLVKWMENDNIYCICFNEELADNLAIRDGLFVEKYPVGRINFELEDGRYELYTVNGMFAFRERTGADVMLK